MVQDLVPLGVGPSLATAVLNRTNWQGAVKGNLENIASRCQWRRVTRQSARAPSS